MDDSYAEKSTRFTEAMNRVDLVFQPSRMHPYTIAKAVYFHKAEKPEIFIDFFARKTVGVIDDAFRTLTFPSRLTASQRKGLAHYREEINRIWMISGRHIINKVLSRFSSVYESNKSHDKDIEKINRAIFNRRLQSIALSYVTGEGTRLVIGDHQRVRDVIDNPSQFNVLEQMCERALKTFIAEWKVLGLDAESQLQEGRMVVWQCAQKYEGRNFARFQTMARQALRNKAIDLTRYFTAHCRRVSRVSFPMGLGEEGSRLAEALDGISFRGWRLGILNGGYARIEFPEPQNPVSEFETKYAVDEGSARELDDSNSPVGLERGVELIGGGEMAKRRGDWVNLDAYIEWRQECLDKAKFKNQMIKKRVKANF